MRGSEYSYYDEARRGAKRNKIELPGEKTRKDRERKRENESNRDEKREREKRARK